MAQIKGKLTANVTIDASAEELFMALAKEFGIEEIFQDESRSYSKLDLVKEEAGETPYIVQYEDRSYHGSPSYEEASRRRISQKQYQIACHMGKINALINEIKM